MTMQSDYPLVIIGAGAAGLGASEAATKHKIEHVVLEASHRTGGRGLTEMLDGRIPIDLGCHWMHSASLNPYVKWADNFGFDYQTSHRAREFHFLGELLNENKSQTVDQYIGSVYAGIAAKAEQGQDESIWSCMQDDNEFQTWLMYWFSLMHSNDVDQVSVMDAYHYNDTEEDWPLKQGYGALIAQQGKNCPVSLNTVVESIDWSGSPIVVKTNQGVIKTQKVLITVSTGILGAGDIQFLPALPGWKQSAIEALPIGNYNNLFFSFDEDTFGQREWNVAWQNGDQSCGIQIGQFGQPYLFGCTGGRFAWWLEKQGERASEAFLREALIEIFGQDINKKLKTFKASAWGFDPWYKGAYSSAKPGMGHMRAELAKPIDDALFFAGEATSTDFLNTAHGAYLSGLRGVEEVSNTL